MYNHSSHSCQDLKINPEKIASLFRFLNGANNEVKASLTENTRHSQYTWNDTIQFYISWEKFDFILYGYKHTKTENEMLRYLTEKITSDINE